MLNDLLLQINNWSFINLEFHIPTSILPFEIENMFILYSVFINILFFSNSPVVVVGVGAPAYLMVPGNFNLSFKELLMYLLNIMKSYGSNFSVQSQNCLLKPPLRMGTHRAAWKMNLFFYRGFVNHNFKVPPSSKKVHFLSSSIALLGPSN